MPERRKVAAKVAAWVAIVAYAAIAAAPARAGTDLTDKAVCSRTPAAARARDRLGEVMLHGRFVAYQPTSLHMVNGHPTRAEVASIRADLQVLRPYFDGLITYSSVDGAEAIPAIAASAGFRAVIIGVWNPFDPVQMQAALAAAGEHPDIVIGLSLGNELVFAKRSSFADLAALTVSVRRRLPSIAVSTTEPFHMFREAAAPELLRQLDFMLVNVHPVFQPWFRDAPDRNAAEFVVNVVKQLPEGYCGPILVKEVGEPSAPSEAGFTPDRQASFFTELLTQFPRARERSFAYFSAFDAPWRAFDEIALPNKVSAAQTHPAEAHWGLFDERRRPKPVVARIPLLGSTPR